MASELYKRNANNGIIINANNTAKKKYVITGTGLLIQTGYMLTAKNEMAVRYAQIMPNSSVAALMNKQQEYTLGFSHYFNKHSLKLQTDISKLIKGLDNMLVLKVSGVLSF